MQEAQTKALSHLLTEMATKGDFRFLQERFVVHEQRMDRKLETIRSNLTWRMFAIIGLFSTEATLMNAFSG